MRILPGFNGFICKWGRAVICLAPQLRWRHEIIMFTFFNSSHSLDYRCAFRPNASLWICLFWLGFCTFVPSDSLIQSLAVSRVPVRPLGSFVSFFLLMIVILLLFVDSIRHIVMIYASATSRRYFFAIEYTRIKPRQHWEELNLF